MDKRIVVTLRRAGSFNMVEKQFYSRRTARAYAKALLASARLMDDPNYLRAKVYEGERVMWTRSVPPTWYTFADVVRLVGKDQVVWIDLKPDDMGEVALPEVK